MGIVHKNVDCAKSFYDCVDESNALLCHGNVAGKCQNLCATFFA